MRKNKIQISKNAHGENQFSLDFWDNNLQSI